MTTYEIVEQIAANNLSIRRIPEKVVETYSLENYKEGDEIITWTFNRNRFAVMYGEKAADQHQASWNKRYPEGRKMCRRIRIPEHAGMWLCKVVNNTDSIVRWDIRSKQDTVFIGETLSDCITKFLKYKKQYEQ